MSIAQEFQKCKEYLDNFHNRQEQVIKASRDITSYSKKIIFALHSNASDRRDTAENLYKSIHDKLESIKPIIEHSQHIFAKSLSGCMQEYVEALSFEHYLETRTIISLGKVQELTPEVKVTTTDYLLGVMDLTGELMRLALTKLTDLDWTMSESHSHCHSIRPVNKLCD